MPNVFDDWPPTSPDNGKKWSNAKLTILKLLWPGEWIEGAKIFDATRQTYYDRRLRELRENGWQIETRSAGGNSKYRLCSHKKLSGMTRQYPTAHQKRAVRQRDHGVCCICGLSDKHLQYDHKIPLERHGLTTTENLQLLCRACNIDKRGICKHCKMTSCEECPYAYPERFQTRFTIFFDSETAERLKSDSDKAGMSPASLLKEIIMIYYASRK